MRDAGLAHVLAIAGLHMALVGLGLFWVVRAMLAAIPRLALRYPIKKWAAAAALCSAAFYLMISGAHRRRPARLCHAGDDAAGDPVRPAGAVDAFAGAGGGDHSYRSARKVCSNRDFRCLRRGDEPDRGGGMGGDATAREVEVAPPAFATVRRYLRGIAITSLVGSIATMPFAIFHFDRATHYAVLGNLLAMPMMGFVAMPAAALSVVLMPFGLDAWPLHVLGWGIEFMLAVGRWVSGLPGAVSVMPAWPVGALVADVAWRAVDRRSGARAGAGWGLRRCVAGIAVAYCDTAARSAGRPRRRDGRVARARRLAAALCARRRTNTRPTTG